MIDRNWFWGLLSAAALGFITSVPQLMLCYERGSKWNGSYAYFDRDEFAYSAYINALIDGRPRRNDPFTGDYNTQYQSLFSIQFIPAYSIALPARVLHISGSTAFIIIAPVITIGASLILFFLLFDVCQNTVLSAVGSFTILCSGVLVSQAPLKSVWIPVAF